MVQTYVGTLRIIECGHLSCGVTFALSENYARRRENDHETFYCPNGHSRYYPQKTDLELAKEQRDNALRRATQLSGLLTDERDQHRRTERRLRSTRGVVTKTKQHIAAGACPRCHARFPDLKHHMEEKHPDYAETTYNKGVAGAK
jgi:hypothetical protein